ncbi:MAG TPA: hypothetical protein VGB77_08105 [Abditibacteriaceae bacterium]
MGTLKTPHVAKIAPSLVALTLCGSGLLIQARPTTASPRRPLPFQLPVTAPNGLPDAVPALTPESLRPHPRPIVDNVQMQCTLVAPLVVTARDLANGLIEAHGVIRIVINSSAGCIVQVGSARGSGQTLRLDGANDSNLEIKVENRVTGGQVLGAFADYAPVPSGRRNLWASTRPVASDSNRPALEISIRIKSLSRYAPGDYATGLSFTVLPN